MAIEFIRVVRIRRHGDAVGGVSRGGGGGGRQLPRQRALLASTGHLTLFTTEKYSNSQWLFTFLESCSILFDVFNCDSRHNWRRRGARRRPARQRRSPPRAAPRTRPPRTRPPRTPPPRTRRTSAGCAPQVHTPHRTPHTPPTLNYLSNNTNQSFFEILAVRNCNI